MSAQLPQIISSLNPNPEPIAEKDAQITELGGRSEIPDWLRETENLPTTPENQPIYNEPGKNTPSFKEVATSEIYKNKEPKLPTGELVGEQSLQKDPEVTATTKNADEVESVFIQQVTSIT